MTDTVDMRRLRIKPPSEEIFDPLGPLQAGWDEEPDDAEVQVDYENNQEYIGTADFIIWVRSTQEEIIRIPSEDLQQLSQPGLQRAINKAWDEARRIKKEFLAQLQKELEEEEAAKAEKEEKAAKSSKK